jgi:DUF4097 and DUF4098 domain-containing protein YvlB
MKKVVHLVVILIVFAATALGSGIQGSFDRTLNVSGTVDIEVSTGSGSIEIRQGSANRVEVHGKIRAGTDWWRSDRDAEEAVRRVKSNPPIEQSGQAIRIGRIAGEARERNISISYEIVVPAQTNVRSRTGSGSITLRDIKGALDANTGSGSIHATGVSGGLRMRTGSGGIHVEGEQTARWELETGSGGIDVHLPRNAGFELSAHTGSGGVHVDYPMTVQGRVDRNRHDVSGRVGNGGHTLNARTGSGPIRIN